MNDSLPAPIRAITPEHPRVFCGYDTLYVTPADGDGYQYIHVFKMLPSRLVGLYPSKSLSAESLADAMFQFFTTYGVTEVIVTDPGSNINSDVVKLLLKWFGVRLRMSIVGRHESNYVERTNKEVLRFLSALVHCERLKKIWAKPQVISLIQFMLNEAVNAETGLSPFEYVFGSVDAKYFLLPDDTNMEMKSGVYMTQLNDNLRVIREEAQRIQLREQEKRLVHGAGDNAYQVGDLVFRKVEKMVDKVSKLTPNYLGPYEVMKVYKSDITCRHLVTQALSILHMDKLKMCFSTKAEAYEAAKVDYDQYEVDRIVSYRGDPEKRSTMEFEVLFQDGSVVWLPYSKDLSDTVQFENYVRANKPLTPLLYTLKIWEKMLKESFPKVIGVSPGDDCYVDLRAWGYGYFIALQLPVIDKSYVVLCHYLRWNDARHKGIVVSSEIFASRFVWNSFCVYAYGMEKLFDADVMVLVDEEFCHRYPQVCSG
jgi:hypothetical protein